MKNNYQMITLCDYFNMLDAKNTNNGENQIKSNMEKYLLSVQRAKTNAKILEALLA